jgi:hypothetical protein
VGNVSHSRIQFHVLPVVILEVVYFIKECGICRITVLAPMFVLTCILSRSNVFVVLKQVQFLCL